MAMSGPVIKHRDATLGRIKRFIGDTFYTDVNLKGRLHPKKQAIHELWHYAAAGRIPYKEAVSAKFSQVKAGSQYGPTWSTHWFRLDLDIPKDWVKEEVRLIWKSDSEALIWENGEPLQGLSGSGSPHSQSRCEFILSSMLKKTELKRTLYVELACNGMFGQGKGDLISPPDPDKTFTLQTVDIVVVDQQVSKLLYDFDVLLMIAKDLPEESHRGNEAMFLANSMINTIDVDDRKTYSLASKMADSFFAENNGRSQIVLHAMGHCHMDSAWLWPYAETIRKCARSWSATLQLMDKYDDMTFTCSQAQQFEWIRVNYPGLFEKIRKRVKEGRFIPVGGSWVEMDGNLPSGESFVRQMLYGQRFFEKEFGSKCTEFWLPDTFGYSAQLPQIVSQAGMSRFLTQKLSWSVNKFPHHTFHWESLDGSRVTTHFPPGDNYCMSATVDELMLTVNNCEDKGRVKNLAYLYGYGDGGGGPTELMLERIQRMKDCDGIPIIQHSTPAEMFSLIEKNEADRICRWVGELYLEFHQGTYTTQARTKKFNRKCELMLRDLEFVCTMTSFLHGDSYPQEELERLWRDVLLNQFHDVLPGSSIHQVYEDSDKLFEDVISNGTHMIKENAGKFARLQAGAGTQNTALVVNTLGWNRKAVVEFPHDVLVGSQPTSSKSKKKRKADLPAGYQRASNGNVLVVADVPSFGYLCIEKPMVSSESSISEEKDEQGNTVYHLRNKELVAMIDTLGRVKSLKKTENNREAVAEGLLANQFVIFNDQPAYWDAWDVNHYHLETRKPITAIEGRTKVVETGPHRVALEVSLRISPNSIIKQTISLSCTDNFLRFDTWVDWHESHKFLKVEFPLNVHCHHATYDIQFGHVQRPTHHNTKYDWMKFEVGGHKWADLSEHGFGVSLLNDCKYGHSCHDNLMRLSLLKSSKAPDESADMGEQTFSYALRPHLGTLQSDKVIQDAYEFNCPLQTFSLPAEKGGIREQSYISVTGDDAIILETVKMDENKEGWLVLRLFEAYGSHATAMVEVHFADIIQVQECNILEEPMEENQKITLESGIIHVTLSPFKILTLRCKLDNKA